VSTTQRTPLRCPWKTSSTQHCRQEARCRVPLVFRFTRSLPLLHSSASSLCLLMGREAAAAHLCAQLGCLHSQPDCDICRHCLQLLTPTQLAPLKCFMQVQHPGGVKQRCWWAEIHWASAAGLCVSYRGVLLICWVSHIKL